MRRSSRLLQAVRQSGKDDHDKFSLPTGSGFIEDILKVGARRFVTDAEFGRSGSQRFSCDEMERYSGLSWRQAKVASQPIDGLVHDKAPFKTARLLVAMPSPEDLSLCAKHLLSEATIALNPVEEGSSKKPDRMGLSGTSRDRRDRRQRPSEPPHEVTVRRP